MWEYFQLDKLKLLCAQIRIFKVYEIAFLCIRICKKEINLIISMIHIQLNVY